MSKDLYNTFNEETVSSYIGIKYTQAMVDIHQMKTCLDLSVEGISVPTLFDYFINLQTGEWENA